MDIRNATASWSGYSHQGKVGICIALNEIVTLIEKEDDISNWWVEYETAEDIDIKCSGEVMSRHQVKAYKTGKNLNDYKDVLNEQKVVCEGGKLNIIQKGFQIHEYNEDNGYLMTTIPEEARFLHTVCEVRGFGLTEEAYEKLDLPYKPSFVPNPNNIKLYTYPDDKKYCDIFGEKDIIMKFCKEYIKELLTIENSDFSDDQLRHENIFYEIVDILDKKILKGHCEGTFPILYFKEIFKVIIDVEKIEKNNLQIIRNLFIKIWEEFISDIWRNKEIEDYSVLKITEKYVEAIFRLDYAEFEQLLRDLNPDECVHSIAGIEGITALCKRNAFKDLFFYCLIKVRSDDFVLSERGYRTNGGYVLTLITDRPSMAGSVLEKVVLNKRITKAIFEKKYFVNDKIESVTFANIIEELSDEESLWKNLQNNWRKTPEEGRFLCPEMTFITYDKAIKDINGE